MRILVVAYEFPPSASPASLRWRYLGRELVANGHAVTALAPRLPEAPGAPAAPEGVRIVRTFAGPVVGLLEWNSRRKARSAPPARPSDEAEPPDAVRPRLATTNWKHAFVHAVQKLQAALMFPDSRAEWRPWAARALATELECRVPDVVISAHEPATTLQLGFEAAKRGIPWVLDLGDPVLAPYTPQRWRGRALRLEGRACHAATHVVVTTDAAREMLLERHALDPAKVSVLTQGFEDRAAKQPGVAGGSASPDLELLYCGRFYSFRRPDRLMAAVAALDGVRLAIASPQAPAEYARFAEASQGRIRYLGHVPHHEVLGLQRQADVLVSIGNDGMVAQTPGKLYEYFGAGRPILHLRAQGREDPAGRLVESLGAGWTCANEAAAVAELLEKLLAAKHNAALTRGTAFAGGFEAFGWSRIGQRYSVLLERLARSAGPQ